MSRFIKGESRSQITLFPEAVDEYIEEDNPARVIDVFVDDLDLSALGFKTEPAATGRPAYYPGVMLKLFIYGYLNRVQSSLVIGLHALCDEIPMYHRQESAYQSLGT